MNLPIKFFKSDVIKGKCAKVGDRFTAFFLVSEIEFEVSEHHGDFFFAEMVE